MRDERRRAKILRASAPRAANSDAQEMLISSEVFQFGARARDAETRIVENNLARVVRARRATTPRINRAPYTFR
ncbi:MAG TPA: hypothetical protein VFB31_13635 [Pseudolabrys sp.]|nr:hypothetical protein [Pseudolabrys sp.]